MFIGHYDSSYEDVLGGRYVHEDIMQTLRS